MSSKDVIELCGRNMLPSEVRRQDILPNHADKVYGREVRSSRVLKTCGQTTLFDYAVEKCGRESRSRYTLKIRHSNTQSPESPRYGQRKLEIDQMEIEDREVDRTEIDKTAIDKIEIDKIEICIVEIVNIKPIRIITANKQKPNNLPICHLM